jgi:hypothetical protein
LFDIHGPNWSAIGAAMGRSSTQVRDHSRTVKYSQGVEHPFVCHSLIDEDRATGAWTQNEERIFETIMLSHIESKMSDSEFPWTQISTQLGTRTPMQCARKWYAHGLAHSLASGLMDSAIWYSAAAIGCVGQRS